MWSRGAGRPAKAYHTITMLLPSFPAGHIPTAGHAANPIVLLSLDASNALNCISRQACFDTIFGSASKWYDDGLVAPGTPIKAPISLCPFLKFLEAHSSLSANLGYTAWDTNGHLYVRGKAGVQQGDLPSSSIFSLWLHPILICTLYHFGGVYAVAFCDNVFRVGALDHALACADDLVVWSPQYGMS